MTLEIVKDPKRCNDWGEAQEVSRVYKCPKCGAESED